MSAAEGLVLPRCYVVSLGKHIRTFLCILIVVYVFLDAAILTEVFPCFFLSCKANARVYLAKTGHGPHSPIVVSFLLLCSMYCLFCVVLCIVCV